MKPDALTSRNCGRPRHVLRVCLFASMLALVAVAPLAGAADDRKPPAPYALIFGTVWSPEDRPAAGVKVKIRRADDKKARWELLSDRRGEFAQRVPAGAADYVVWAEVKGHKGAAAETKVHIENDERQDIGLHLTK